MTAFVVLRARGVAKREATGNTAEVGIENELIEFTRKRLASYKVPKSIHCIDAIPKSAVGKVLRRALRDSLWTSINPGQS